MVWITCGLLWCFYQLFGLSFWRHPFTAEDPLVSKWWNATFLQICSHEETNLSTSWMAWGWVTFQKLQFLSEPFLYFIYLLFNTMSASRLFWTIPLSSPCRNVQCKYLYLYLSWRERWLSEWQTLLSPASWTCTCAPAVIWPCGAPADLLIWPVQHPWCNPPQTPACPRRAASGKPHAGWGSPSTRSAGDSSDQTDRDWRNLQEWWSDWSDNCLFKKQLYDPRNWLKK